MADHDMLFSRNHRDWVNQAEKYTIFFGISEHAHEKIRMSHPQNRNNWPCGWRDKVRKNSAA